MRIRFCTPTVLFAFCCQPARPIVSRVSWPGPALSPSSTQVVPHPTAPCVAGRRWWCHHLSLSASASSGAREDDSSVLHRYGIPPLLRHVQHEGAGVAQLVVGARSVEKEAALKGSPLAAFGATRERKLRRHWLGFNKALVSEKAHDGKVLV